MKLNADGSIQKQKARLVAKGNLQQSHRSPGCYSCPHRLSNTKELEDLSTVCKISNSKWYIQEEIYVAQQQGSITIVQEEKVLKLKKPSTG